jgi:aminomethyltransferase
MSQEADAPLRKTPLNAACRALGARMVPFAGWDMAVQFTSVIEEHMAVRTAAGLFDVSHMGEIEVEGRGALALVQRLTCNDAARLDEGQAQYSALTNERGAFVDDILVYRRRGDRYLLVVNAGNSDQDAAWVLGHAQGTKDVTARDASPRFSQLAVQGPASAAIIERVCGVPVGDLGSYRFLEVPIRRAPSILSRTGYTGEDGFEIYGPPEAAPDLFQALLDGGRDLGLKPCGLGARDTLRLEARLPLYGNDIDDTTTVLEAGLKRFLRLDKGEFIGRAALERQEREGVARKMVGLEMTDRGIARHGYPIRAEGKEIGVVTSGTFGPFVKKNIALAYVPPSRAAVGTQLEVVIRERGAAAVVVPTPFYRRAARS